VQTRGAKLGPPPAPIDIRVYRKEFIETKKGCEFPNLQTGDSGCTNMAWHVYITDWSVVFICTGHRDYIKSLSKREMLVIDMRIAEILWAQFCRRSWVVMNASSNGELARRVVEANDEAKRAASAPAKRRAAQERTLRKKIAEQEVRVGAPDSELLEARTGKVIPQQVIEEHEEPVKSVSSADLPLFLPTFGGKR
jgi:hypothetical protein